MTKFIIDQKVMGYLSLGVWLIGLLAFLLLSLSNILGAIQFLFSFFSSLVSEAKPSADSLTHAKIALSNLFPVFVFCLLAQLAIFSFPFLLTGSQEAIAFYHDREEDYAKVLAGRIDLAMQIDGVSKRMSNLEAEILGCHALLGRLRRDMKVLTDAIELTRESLPASYRKKPDEDDKGDF